MWSVVLLGLAGFLGGGALSLRKQSAHISWQIALWVLAVTAVVAAWALTY
ncbi:hypothetical protein [Glutamicibacter sp. PS]|nr:hypothetical protein [Glutamicibacter sp. PS]MDR4533337.1 hypothetical protein [Glutamicibacter sp. PS]